MSPVVIGERRLLFSIVHDETERKRAEEALSESSDFLKEAQRIGDLGCYVLDCSTGEWTSTGRLNQIFGINGNYPRTVEGWEELVHPEDRAMMEDYFAGEVLGKGRPFDKEYRILRPTDGTMRWVRGLGKLEFDDRGKPLKMRGIISDITAHREWRAQLEESEERFRATFEQAAVGIVHTSFEGNILRCNARFAELTGYTSEEIVGLAVQQVTAPENAALTAALMQRIRNGGRAETMEKRYIRKGGGSFWAETTVCLQRDSQGRALHLIAFVDDITERKWAEMQLSESEDRYRSTFEQAAVGIVHASLEGRFLSCNPRFAEIIGYSQTEVSAWASSRLLPRRTWMPPTRHTGKSSMA